MAADGQVAEPEPACRDMITTASGNLRLLERVVVSLESSPWDKLYRAAIGYCLLPVYLRSTGKSNASWNFIAFFLLVLLALRVVPGVLRRVLPFSRELRLVWADRRALAKRYDSHQWRKLFGLGVGLLAFLVFSGKYENPPLVLGVVCILVGAIGELVWFKSSKAITTQPTASASAT